MRVSWTENLGHLSWAQVADVKLYQRYLIVRANKNPFTHLHFLILDGPDFVFVFDNDIIDMSLLCVTKLVLTTAPFCRQLVLKLHAPSL